MALISFAKSDSMAFSRYMGRLAAANISIDNKSISSKINELQYDTYDNTPTQLETVAISSTSGSPQYRPSHSLGNHDRSMVSPQNRAECEPLKPGFVTRELMFILSREMFSLPDPFRYVIEKTMKMSNSYISRVSLTLNELLQTEDLPLCYMPYAKSLSSLFRYWPDLDALKQYIRRIQVVRPSNDVDFSFLPSDISLSPELFDLFSTDIFADSTPPVRILFKLLDLPKSQILNLQPQLKKFVERLMAEVQNIPFSKRYYIWYINAVRKFLQNKSALDELKRDMAAIQPVATSDQRFMPSTLMT